MSIVAEAEVRPTEDRDKVAKAINNLFTGPLVERQDGKRVFLTLKADNVGSLERFKMIIQRDRIRSAAGAVLRRASGPDGVRVFLNKQVAYVSHVSFCEPEGESPLGPISLFIQTNEPFKIVNWITGGMAEPERKPGRRRANLNEAPDDLP